LTSTIDAMATTVHNSPWKTDFRRDYITDTAYHFKVDADIKISTAPPAPSTPITLNEQHDLLRHRCWVRTPGNPAAHDAWPGQWRLTVGRAIPTNQTAEPDAATPRSAIPRGHSTHADGFGSTG
jgi:hypothetical protein